MKHAETKQRETRGELAARFKARARSIYLSHETIDWYSDKATLGQLASVCSLIEKELSVRAAAKRARLLRQAKFPQMKSIEGYDFKDVCLPAGYTKDDLLSLRFIEDAEDFVLYGSCGLGKTHLAIALGMLAIEQGKAVRYFSAADLVLQLKAAAETGRLDAKLADIRKADLLIIDEFGYIPVDVEGARLLYQVMAATYEANSMIVTTNIEFSKWGTVLADEKLAQASVDRIVHHGRLIEFSGQSKRLSQALMMGKG